MRGRGRGHDGLLLQKLKLFDSSECDASRLFALHHVLERRARAERRIIGRRNLQRRTRGRVTSLARGARLSGKRAKLGDGHLVARANGRADLIERRRQHASDVRLRLTRLRRHGIDESLLVQSRRRVSPTIESRRVHSSVVASRAPSRRNLKTRRRPITALDRASHRAAPPPPHPPIVLTITRDDIPIVCTPRSSRLLPHASARRRHHLSRAFERRHRSTARRRRPRRRRSTRTWRRRASSSRARWPTYLSLGSFVRSFVRSRARWRVTRECARAVGSW